MAIALTEATVTAMAAITAATTVTMAADTIAKGMAAATRARNGAGDVAR